MIIEARFNGPPGSGNGGYSAGVFAGGGAWEVTLRVPPPLDTPLTPTDSKIQTPDGAVVAELAPATPITVAVPPIGYADAADAATHYPGFVEHPFPTCYVCGPDRPDGLRVFPGPLVDGTTAAPWTVPDGVAEPMVWAALDCPGGWAVIQGGRPYVLGRIAVRIARVPDPGERCVVRGALAEAEGRKALVHTTLYGQDGDEVARSRATWIAIAR
ncbi:hypothetical protein RB614_14120 [Phytohabitans sp. ZYX-F-186]|uniref:N-terminal of MaoC-like dehydratase domain-containing protein n=1 Tax=Phytohabitans maris TaxID=3071409 RepID=A0ABU0ZF30_9ACTN|nr:hypothetical protein [Phytohabitans sp. ZYX-F-186]MDQ7905650.1 hypothetical protein [Phytohabitans sp. ZYX-F-186]